MRFIKFEIKNFRGIEHAIIDLEPAGANIFTLVGVNESGKTSILEAINMFNIEKGNIEELQTREAVEESDVIESYIPRHKMSNFSEDITVKSTFKLEISERKQIARIIAWEFDIEFDYENIPEIIVIKRGYSFESTKTTDTIYTIDTGLLGGYFKELSASIIEEQIKIEEEEGGEEEEEEEEEEDAEEEEEEEEDAEEEDAETRKEKLYKKFSTTANNAFAKLIPQITYFSTFLLERPDEIILNPNEENENIVNKLYRKIFQNIASASNHTDIRSLIVDRQLSEDKLDKEALGATLRDLSADFTKTFFETWEKILGTDIDSSRSKNSSDREIKIECGVMESDEDGSDDESFVYVKFNIYFGRGKYSLSDMSLGFRWFFSFILFTYYKVIGSNEKSILFLMDEPASNLHPKAQGKLLTSFNKVVNEASNDVQIIYSTHSHHLIEPAWLEQAFIVSNAAVDFEKNDLAHNPPENNQIEIQKYKNFVSQHSDKTTHFQPVLDKLEVSPSKLEILQERPILLVEGKGDFFMLEYARQILNNSKTDYGIIPAGGATSMNRIIPFLLGWGIDFIICLDADIAGKRKQTSYIREWGFKDTIWTLRDIDNELDEQSIEGFLEDEDISIIEEYFSSKIPRKGKKFKKIVQMFFSNALANKDDSFSFSEKFKNRIASFDKKIHNALFKMKEAE